MVNIADTINKIHMKPEAEAQILANLKKFETDGKIERKQTGVSYAFLGRLGIAAACLTAAVCVTIPVRAYVLSLVRERMEQVPQEELTAVAEALEQNDVSADGFSRAFTDAEEARLVELAALYNQGLFPEGSVTEVDSAEAAVADALCYNLATGAYFLPERELTDEELLEYLDYQAKLAFALKQNAEKEAPAQERPLQGVSAEDGITIREAEEICIGLMDSVFEKDTAGYEKHSFLEYTGEEEPMIDTVKYPSQYMVNFSVIHDYYYFNIDTVTGNVARVQHSYAQADSETLTQSEAEKLFAEDRAEAERLLREVFGKTDEIDRVYGSYLLNKDGAVVSDRLAYQFVAADGTGYFIVLDGRTKGLVEFRDTCYEMYIQMREKNEAELAERYGEAGDWKAGERIVVELE